MVVGGNVLIATSYKLQVSWRFEIDLEIELSEENLDLSLTKLFIMIVPLLVKTFTESHLLVFLTQIVLGAIPWVRIRGIDSSVRTREH